MSSFVTFLIFLHISPIQGGLLDFFDVFTWGVKDKYFTETWSEEVKYQSLTTITFSAVCDWAPDGLMVEAYSQKSAGAPAGSTSCGRPCELLDTAFGGTLPSANSYYSDSDHVQVVNLVGSSGSAIPLSSVDPDIAANTFLSFRGTYVWDFVNNRRNKKFMLVPVSAFCAGCAAHRGWYSNFVALRYVIGSAASTSQAYLYPADPKFGITGHSMGAALAQLASVYISFKVGSGSYFESTVNSLYTFGCPRLGNKLIADKVKSSAQFSAAFNIYSDVVGHIPFRIMGYRHSFKKIYEIFIDPVYFTGYSTGDIDDDFSKYMSYVLHRTDADFSSTSFSLSFADHNSYFVGLSDTDLASCGGLADHFLKNSKAMSLFM